MCADPVNKKHWVTGPLLDGIIWSSFVFQAYIGIYLQEHMNPAAVLSSRPEWAASTCIYINTGETIFPTGEAEENTVGVDRGYCATQITGAAAASTHGKL
jgi:hypothetical protein